MKSLRFFAGLILFLSIFLFPWWVFIVLSLVLIFYFESYYEIIVGAFVMDFLYGTPDHFWGFFFTLYTAVVFLVSFGLKKRLKFY